MENKDFYSQLHDRIMKLTIPQIESIWEDFKKLHSPEEREYRNFQNVFNMAIEEKKSMEVKADILKLLDKVENAPDGVTAPSQGNETKQPTRSSVSPVL